MRLYTTAPFPYLKELNIGKEHLSPVREQKKGSQRTFIVRNRATDALLKERYGRDELCLKVFRPKIGPNRPRWEGTHVVECTKVQNLFALEDMAPRVYDLIIINGKLLAQVTDYLEGRNGEIDRDKFALVMKKYDLGPSHPSRHKWKMPPHNYVGDKIVDFGGLYFNDARDYQRGLIDKARLSSKGHSKPYQNIREFDVEGMRDIDHRIDIMQLGEIDFEGKDVLDLGCNGGAFCREAWDRSARRIVGVDRELASAAYELSNWLGYWNIDFLSLRLPGQWSEIQSTIKLTQFDVVFAFAITDHAGGIRQWLADICRETLLFEGGRAPRERYEPHLKEKFDIVEFLGYTTDMGKRPVYRCWK